MAVNFRGKKFYGIDPDADCDEGNVHAANLIESRFYDGLVLKDRLHWRQNYA